MGIKINHRGCLGNRKFCLVIATVLVVAGLGGCGHPVAQDCRSSAWFRGVEVELAKLSPGGEMKIDLLDCGINMGFAQFVGSSGKSADSDRNYFQNAAMTNGWELSVDDGSGEDDECMVKEIGGMRTFSYIAATGGSDSYAIVFDTAAC